MRPPLVASCQGLGQAVGGAVRVFVYPLRGSHLRRWAARHCLPSMLMP
jgi:hypothetical protein